MLETLPLAELYGVAARRPFLCSSPSGHECRPVRASSGNFQWPKIRSTDVWKSRQSFRSTIRCRGRSGPMSCSDKMSGSTTPHPNRHRKPLPPKPEAASRYRRIPCTARLACAPGSLTMCSLPSRSTETHPRRIFCTRPPLTSSPSAPRDGSRTKKSSSPSSSRAPVEGTRQGRTVLVQMRDGADPESGERYTPSSVTRARRRATETPGTTRRSHSIRSTRTSSRSS